MILYTKELTDWREGQVERYVTNYVYTLVLRGKEQGGRDRDSRRT